MKMNDMRRFLHLVIVMLCAVCAWAYEFTENGIRYREIVVNGRTALEVIALSSGQYSGDVVIPDQLDGDPVVSIGEKAFYHCTGLTSVVIPDGVTSIGFSAFYNCLHLTSVTFPKSLTTIGSYAFAYSWLLKSVDLSGTGLQSIQYRAFFECSDLASVALPSSLNTLESEVFSKCASDIEFHIDIKDVESWMKKTYNMRLTGYRHLMLGGKELTDVVVPDGTTRVGQYAFYRCSSIASVEIPASTTSIEISAFGSCTSLARVSLHGSVQEIDSWAFKDCSSGVQTFVEVGDIAAWCGNIINRFLPGERHLMQGGDELTDVVIPEEVSKIEQAAFKGFSSLVSVVLHEGVANIGESAFEGCSHLCSVCNTAAAPPAIPASSFKGIFKNAVLYVPDESLVKYKRSGWGQSGFFAQLLPLTDCDRFVVANGMTCYMSTQDGEPALKVVSLLDKGSSTVVIPDEVDGLPVVGIWANAFAGNASLSSITIGDNVRSIGRNAFQGCPNLRDVTCLPETPPTLMSEAFGAAPTAGMTLHVRRTCLKDYKDSDWASYFASIVEDMAGKGSVIIYYAPSKMIDATTATGSNFHPDAFDARVVSHTFENWQGRIVFDDAVTIIGDNAFRNIQNITDITIPRTVTRIGDDAFIFLRSLKSIDLPSGLTSIGSRAFELCQNLQSITIPDAVTHIGSYAFNRCEAVKDISIGKKVSEIGQEAFYSTNAATITVDRDNPYYDSRNDCNAIIETATDKLIVGCPSTIIPESVTSIGTDAFRYNRVLNSITIPENVSSIEYGAFEFCSNLKEMVCKAAGPPTATEFVFYYTPIASGTLRVPAASVEAYRNAPGWKDWGRIVAIEDEDGICSPAAEGQAGEMHDLQGRRVLKPTRGIFIRDGRKVLVE